MSHGEVYYMWPSYSLVDHEPNSSSCSLAAFLSAFLSVRESKNTTDGAHTKALRLPGRGLMATHFFSLPSCTQKATLITYAILSILYYPYYIIYTILSILYYPYYIIYTISIYTISIYSRLYIHQLIWSDEA